MREPRTALLLCALVAALGAGCSSHVTTVPLLTAAGIPVSLTPSPDVPLEVVTRSTAVRDPLPVDGSSVEFADIEGALGHAVSSAAVPWAEAHRAQRPEGWQLTVELIQAESDYKGGRLRIALVARATLKTRNGNEYIAQTNMRCRDAGLTTPETGGTVVYACMTQLGRDLANWLGGVEP